MTNAEFVSRILNTNKLLTKDGHISRRHVLFAGRTKAKALISQRLDEFKLMNDQSIITSIKCFELESVDWTDCNVFEFKVCENIMKSTKKLPEIVTGKIGSAVLLVTSVDGSIIYDEISPRSFKNLQSRKYKIKTEDFYTIQDGYIVLPNSTNEIINLDVIVLDKYDAMQVAGCDCGEDCDSVWDMDFVCPDVHLETVITSTLQEIASIYSRTPKDENPNMDENQKSQTVR